MPEAVTRGINPLLAAAAMALAGYALFGANPYGLRVLTVFESPQASIAVHVGQQQPPFPIVADPDKKVAGLYDMIHPNGDDTATVRSVFIIGPDKKIKLTLTYPASTGRNFAELLRVIDSLQLTSNYKVATPANWQHGQDCIITPAVKDEDVPKLFPKGSRTVKPYLRYTPQPNV